MCGLGAGREPRNWLDPVCPFHYQAAILTLFTKTFFLAQMQKLEPQAHQSLTLYTNCRFTTAQPPPKVLAVPNQASFQPVGRERGVSALGSSFWGFCHKAQNGSPYWDLREKMKPGQWQASFKPACHHFIGKAFLFDFLKSMFPKLGLALQPLGLSPSYVKWKGWARGCPMHPEALIFAWSHDLLIIKDAGDQQRPGKPKRMEKPRDLNVSTLE